MKLNPCTTCKSAGEFVVNNDLTAIACSECGARVEQSISQVNAFELWNKYNPLQKKEPRRLVVGTCAECPLPYGVAVDRNLRCALTVQVINNINAAAPSWCPLRECGLLVEFKEGA